MRRSLVARSSLRRGAGPLKRRMRLLVVAGLAMVIFAGLLPAAAVAKAGSGYVNPWAPENEDPNSNTPISSCTQANTDARNFNLIIAHATRYASCVSGM